MFSGGKKQISFLISCLQYVNGFDTSIALNKMIFLILKELTGSISSDGP